MPKNIVVCSDGTGNTAIKGRGTNVFKLYEAVDVVGHLHDPALCEQVAIYDDGVGTQKLKLLRGLSGAFGFGLARNVRQLYAEIARIYKDEDRIYIFGFSRGAFTARTLAGLICHAGILDTEDLTAGQVSSRVSNLYREYRKSKPALLERLTSLITDSVRVLWRFLKKLFRPGQSAADAARTQAARVRFVGVWDTVDAVGFPVPGIASFWNTVIHRFKFTNKRLPACVDRACHAMAVDEERASFELSAWDHDEDRTEQVWFAGVHSNVGGGYPKQGMSLVALDWMMRQAEEASKESDSAAPLLRFTKLSREQYAEAQNVKDYLYDSRSGVAVYYRYKPRDIAVICSDAGAPVRIHRSVMDRIEGRTRGYAPGNLPASFEMVDTPGTGHDLGEFQLVEEAGKTKLPKFSGGGGLWVRWRQTVQVAFFVLQFGVIYWAWSADVTSDMLPVAPQEGAPIADKLASWSMGLAEAIVAPIPGDWAATAIVQPMFAYPKIGISFLLVFVICYLLGLLGRARIEAMNSERWRHLKLVLKQ